METNFNVTTTEEGKNVAMVSYFTIIGWLIAYFAMHKDKRTELGSYHLRQTLLLHLVLIVVNVAYRIIINLTYSGVLEAIFGIIYLILFILWVIGFIGAIQGKKKEIPLIGTRSQSMFPGI